MKRVLLFFRKLASKVATYYTDAMAKAKPFLQRELPAAINLVKMLKNVVDSPAADLATLIIPGRFDDAVITSARAFLPLALVKLEIARDITAGASNDEIIQRAIARLRELKILDKVTYHKQLLDLASEISHALIDGKISLSELAGIIQGLYESEYKSQELPAPLQMAA